MAGSRLSTPFGEACSTWQLTSDRTRRSRDQWQRLFRLNLWRTARQRKL
jgi:hypothetical protein